VCRQVPPVLEELRRIFPAVSVRELDVDDEANSKLWSDYGSDAVPYYYVLVDGKIVARFRGFLPSEHAERFLRDALTKLDSPPEATGTVARGEVPVQTDNLGPRTIVPGFGLKECRVGGMVADAQALFGKPSGQEGENVSFAEQGVELATQDGKIHTLFFMYRDRDYKPYSGKTDKGIGPESTIDDVQKAYGKPDRIDENVISKQGSNPGAVEHYLPYSKLGISFIFHDQKLANVRVWIVRK